MASIQQRENQDGTTSWKVSVRITGYPSQHRSFATEEEAKAWADVTEKGLRNPYRLRPTFDMTCDRYINEVLPKKSMSCQEAERRHLSFWREHFSKFYLDEITPFQIESIADMLYEKVSRKTKMNFSTETRRKYLMSLSYLFTVAAKDFVWVKHNPVALVKKHAPKKSPTVKEEQAFDPIREIFIAEIKKEMKKRGFNIGSLAHAMGLNKTSIQAVFDPRINLTVRRLTTVLKALNRRAEITFHDES